MDAACPPEEDLSSVAPAALAALLVQTRQKQTELEDAIAGARFARGGASSEDMLSAVRPGSIRDLSPGSAVRPDKFSALCSELNLALGRASRLKCFCTPGTITVREVALTAVRRRLPSRGGSWMPVTGRCARGARRRQTCAPHPSPGTDSRLCTGTESNIK
jgi:hypothetical protein